jgi:type II secretory pathway pseudopilin PulG
MSGQPGYTAAEALAALAILGLAMAGLTTSMQLITAGQIKARARLEQSMRERAVDQRLEALLARDAPFRSDQTSHLIGNGQMLDAACGSTERCSARIEDGSLVIQRGDGAEKSYRLPDGENPHFVYIGSYSTGGIWPPEALPPPAPSWQTLGAVMIQSKIEGQEKPLVVAKIWRQQRADCEYDVVIQDCRGAAS